ncbi:MAG: hypothetical protein IJU37_06260 [Desulfovibrio sp.]|nr:hypothetical protein [Desulfovibrio sp.]
MLGNMRGKYAAALPYSLLALLAIASAGRIFLAMKLPLFMQDAGADDYLMARYAGTLMAGEWLGDFEQFTLVKVISFPLFLAGSFLLGIPYPLALILFYLSACALLSWVMGRVVSAPRWGALLYLFLLYSPVMLHQENVQKIYRGGCLTAASMLVIAAFIGLFFARGSRSLRYWSLLASLSLPFFYFIKEDGFWLVPFCLGASLLAIVFAWHEQGRENLGRIALLSLLPFVALGLCHTLYCGLNWKYYGAWTVTDRSGTHFRPAAHDLLSIDVGEPNPDVWVSREAFRQAMESSPSLAIFREALGGVYAHSGYVWPDGELHGDFYIWGLRQAVADKGWYAGGYRRVDAIYASIHEELSAAFRDGRLKKKQVFYLSPVTQGIGLCDWVYFRDTFGEHLDVMACYRENAIEVAAAWGDKNHIQELSALTMSPAIWPETSGNAETDIQQRFVDLGNSITYIYSVTGKACLLLGALGLLALLVRVPSAWRKGDAMPLQLLLTMLGLFLSGAALFLGVQWFSRFLGYKKFYDYIACVIPIMQVLELTGCYFLWQSLKELIGRCKGGSDLCG